MLLNSDIQNINYSNDFTLSKRNKCNYVHYRIIFLNSNYFIWTKFNKIWIFKVYVFDMFKMKYLVNKKAM
jgi:hypothetical protein